jgi:hypothetical protein
MIFIFGLPNPRGQDRACADFSNPFAANVVPSPRKLEHDPEKWEPVFRKDHAQTQKGGPRAIQSMRGRL